MTDPVAREGEDRLITRRIRTNTTDKLHSFAAPDKFSGDTDREPPSLVHPARIWQ
jgi:hypothetical protein